MKRALASTLALAAFVLPTLASAGRCFRAGATPHAPFDPAMSVREYGISYGDFGTTPSACSFGSLGLEVGGSALLANVHDNPNLYGVLAGGLQMHLSVPFGDRFFISGSVGLVQYHEVHNATVIASSLGVGPLVVGVHYVLARGDNWQITPYVRAMVFTGTEYAVGFGIEPGVSSVVTVANRFAFHVGASVPASSTQLQSAGVWNAVVRGSLEVAWRFVAPLEIGLGVEVRGRVAPTVVFDKIAPYLGLRAFIGTSTALQLTASALGAGADDTTARFALGVWSAW